MIVLQPHVEMLSDFVNGVLDADAAEAVRAWLYTGATADEIALYEAFVEERERARHHLLHAASRPTYAKLTYALHNVGSRLAASGDGLMGPRAAGAFGPLGAELDDDLVTQVRSGQPVDVQLVLGADGAYVVLGVESDGEVSERAAGVALAGQRIDLPGFLLEAGDEELVLVVLIDSTGAGPQSAGPPTAAWLLEQLRDPPKGWRIIHRTYRRARFEP